MSRNEAGNNGNIKLSRNILKYMDVLIALGDAEKLEKQAKEAKEKEAKEAKESENAEE